MRIDAKDWLSEGNDLLRDNNRYIAFSKSIVEDRDKSMYDALDYYYDNFKEVQIEDTFVRKTTEDEEYTFTIYVKLPDSDRDALKLAVELIGECPRIGIIEKASIVNNWLKITFTVD